MFTDLKEFLTGRLSNKPFLIWLLTTPPHLKHVASLLCNLPLIASFLTLMFHKVAWQHMPGVVGFLITFLLQIYYRISRWKNCENQLRFDRFIIVSMVSPRGRVPTVEQVGSCVARCCDRQHQPWWVTVGLCETDSPRSASERQVRWLDRLVRAYRT